MIKELTITIAALLFVVTISEEARGVSNQLDKENEQEAERLLLQLKQQKNHILNELIKNKMHLSKRAQKAIEEFHKKNNLS